jgi:Domain of unknown function (DUF6457)
MLTVPSFACRYAVMPTRGQAVSLPAVTGDEWIERFAERALTAPPSREEIGALLALAGVAAHASERTAAPLACWIAGRSALPLRELTELATQVAEQSGGKAGDQPD